MLEWIRRGHRNEGQDTTYEVGLSRKAQEVEMQCLESSGAILRSLGLRGEQAGDMWTRQVLAHQIFLDRYDCLPRQGENHTIIKPAVYTELYAHFELDLRKKIAELSTETLSPEQIVEILRLSRTAVSEIMSINTQFKGVDSTLPLDRAQWRAKLPYARLVGYINSLAGLNDETDESREVLRQAQ